MSLILKINLVCWLGLAVGLVSTAFAVYCLVKKKTSLAWRLGFILACILALETLVFRNPAFFRVAAQHLDVEDIGWRQARALIKETPRFKRPCPTPLLAVGSSQTGAIYIPYAAADPNLVIFTLSGMGPLDLVLYEDLIRRHAPGTIILTLSDFDIGREPSLAGAKLAPPQPPQKLAHICALLLRTREIPWSDVQDFVAANLLSAYRYQYIFKGYLNKWSGRNRAFPESDVTAITDEQYLAAHLESLTELDDRWFGVNLSLLDEFLAWAHANRMAIMVTGGHYHPRALAQNRDLHEQALEALATLCAKYDNVTYVRSEQLYAFSEADYRDGYHLRSEAGLALARRVIESIPPARPVEPVPSHATVMP